MSSVDQLTVEDRVQRQTSAIDEQPSRSVAIRRMLVLASDWLAITFALFVANYVFGIDNLVLLGNFGFLFCGWMVVGRLYNARLVTDRRQELARLIRCGVRTVVTIGVAALLVGADVTLRASIALFFLSLVAVIIERELVRRWFARRRKSGQALWGSVLVAAGETGQQLQDSIGADVSSPHTILERIDPNDYDTKEALLTQTLLAVQRIGAKGVVVVESSISGQRVNHLVRGLLDAGLYVDLASALSDIATERLATRSLGSSVAMWIAPRPRSGWRAFAKRTFDVTIAGGILLAAAPVFAVLALLVKFTSPGPIFFRQERVGRFGKPFAMMKFRSMVVDAEERLADLAQTNEGDGPLFKMRNDPRITKIGAFLRKTSLDELPQLINVLKNEMSLVGPRPALQAETAAWEKDLFARLEVQPGITGMWQVSGRSGTTFAEYTRLDLYYVHNWSLLVDVSILLKTIPAVMKSDGAY